MSFFNEIGGKRQREEEESVKNSNGIYNLSVCVCD